MNQNSKQRANANKIHKWLQAALELRQSKWALPITRLTSIKSLCQEATAAQQFAVYVSQLTQQSMNQAEPNAGLTREEWSTHQTLMADAITQMKGYLATPSNEGKQSLRGLLRQIESLQGDDYRHVHGSTVHFVRSGYLLKLLTFHGIFFR